MIKLRRFVTSMLRALANALFIVLAVEGQSMTPAFEHGDRVLAICKWPHRWIKRNCVVVVSPGEIPLKYRRKDGALDLYIKRVTAVAGDVVVTYADEVSDTQPCEQALLDKRKSYNVLHIPPRHIFVSSDNPYSATDSRAWGPLSHETIVGVVLVRLPKTARTGMQATE